MPSGKTHSKINFLLWIASLIFFLKYQYLIAPYFKIGIWDTYFVGWYISEVWFCLFSLDMFIHTKYLTPDLDTHSQATKNLGVVGWCIDKMFGHRKTLHKTWFWSIFLIPLCYFIGTFFLGGLIAILGHLVSDFIVTGIKRIIPNWIENAVEKVI